MKKWVTLFERFQYFHLFKDVGQIPYHVQEYSENNVEVWRKSAHSDEKSYPYEVIDISSGSSGVKISLSIIKKIIREAKNIDYLNLFHFRKYSLVYAIFYKLFNSDGNVFIKCDFSHDVGLKPAGIVKKLTLKLISKLKLIDLLLIEHLPALHFYQSYGFECLYTPNGVAKEYYSLVQEINKNEIPTIIFVGKCGDKRKNAEDLVRALLSISDTCQWKVMFVGGETTEFKKWFEETTDSLPHDIVERFHFLGFITEASEMVNLYCQSHLFIMTSLSEGYPLSLAESCWCGCYPILSQGSGGNDLIDAGFAIGYQNSDDLKKKVYNSLVNIEFTLEKGRMIRSHIQESNDWRVMVKKIDARFFN